MLSTTTLKNRAPSNSSLSVPQELIEYILEFLHDDVPTLRTCSLVSHAFLPCSRRYIYSSVTIVHVNEWDLFRERYAGQLYRWQNIVALLEHSPHVAQLVTRFGMRSMVQDALMDTSLLTIISSLHNLSHIELIAYHTEEDSWDEFPVVTSKPFLAALRSVPLKTFIVRAVVLESQEQFEALFTAAVNPALKHLSLICDTGATWTTPYPPIRPPLSGLPALESLCIAGYGAASNTSWPFFSQSLYDIRGIRHLSLQLFDDAAVSSVQRLLNVMQGTLESLTLDIGAWIVPPISLDLSGHRKLLSIFTILTFPLDPRFLIIPLTPTLRTLTVEQVCNNRQHNSRPPARAWAEFDAHLDQLALQRVHVRLHEKFDQWKHQVEDAMPSLKSKGILEVEVVRQRYCVPRASTGLLL
ncbi:hypothetical protein EDD18DRAFT_1181013 [Armillaria luteobubalina]|uniref:F-box domain-containing protein n=1 Tax=Armillaria luteobubalina TaxID=153913 RepID=A0AA39Q0V8_9AGAR|nr:hypothetical protein EDD18DRAFT_1181013 [Armillaria luteobubalina]